MGDAGPLAPGATTVPKGAPPSPQMSGSPVEANVGGSPVSQGPMALPRAKSELQTGHVYNFPDGRQGLWNGHEFEVLN